MQLGLEEPLALVEDKMGGLQVEEEAEGVGGS